MAQLVKAGESAKVKITMKLLKLTGVNDLDIKPPNQIFIEWKRGAKKNNAGKTLSYTANATITLEEAIVTECTLEKQKDGTFFKKLVSFAVKDVCVCAVFPILTNRTRKRSRSVRLSLILQHTRNTATSRWNKLWR